MQDNNQQLQPKDLLTHSVKLLNNYLSVYRQGGLVVTGKEKVTLAAVLAEGSFDVKNMVKRDQLDTIAAFYLMALKELWSNTSNTFTNESITSCSLLIINRYGDWHPKELIIVLRNGLAGAYGKTFGKVNTDEVMRWAKEYDEVERTRYFELTNNKKDELGWNEMNPDLLKKIFNPSKYASIKPTYVPRERTTQEQLIQDWMKEFDKMSFEANGKRWVEVPGVDGGGHPETFTVDIEEFLQYKINQQTQ